MNSHQFLPSPGTEPSRPALHTATEIGKCVGVSRRTIGEWTASRKIPAIVIGRKIVRYDLAAVLLALKKFERIAIR